MHLLRFAKQKMLNNLWSLYLKGFFIYLLIDLIFIVTFVIGSYEKSVIYWK